MNQFAGRLPRIDPLVESQHSHRGAFALPFSIVLALLALPGSHASLAAASPPPAPGTILTVAGTGQAGFSGDGGPAAQARLNDPRGLAADTAGNLFIVDAGNARVRRISPDGTITTVAGSGKDTFSGDGGPATKAGVQPVDVFVDSADNLYVTDGSRIRKVSASGIITTVAGGGNPADGLGDGGPATSARLLSAVGVTLDARGNLFIADFGDHRVRMVTPDGAIQTVAGTGKPGFSGDGGPATAAELDGPKGLAVDDAGHLYIADTFNHRVRMVGPDGTIHTVAGGGSPADGLGDGGLATDARLNTLTRLALDGAGDLFIPDANDHRIRRVGPVGIITTVAGTGMAGFAGDGGPATQAELRAPFGVALDQGGNLYFSDRASVTADNSNFVGPDNERIREVVGVGVPR